MLKLSRPTFIQMVLLTTLLIGVLFPVGAQAQIGACCSGAVCFVSSPAGCAGAFPPGAYQGDGSSCPGLCLQQGACCFTDGSCQFLHFGPCNVADGTFQGQGSTCLPNSCPPPAPVPTQINHQGVVSVMGQRFTGDGRFYFAIIDPDTGNSVWTNDATNIGTANRPNQPVLIDCANGLYDVRLGDLTSYDNMKPLAVDVFLSPNRTLRIWFNDGVNGVFQLTPDHVLTSTPYAMRAATTGGTTKTVVFSAGGTWIKPLGVTSVEIILIGGGGGGGRPLLNGTFGKGGAGGGGGGLTRRTFAASALGATEIVIVGAGGAGGALNGTPGSGGGSTSFGSWLVAGGGGGGAETISGVGGNGDGPGSASVSQNIAGIAALLGGASGGCGEDNGSNGHPGGAASSFGGGGGGSGGRQSEDGGAGGAQSFRGTPIPGGAAGVFPSLNGGTPADVTQNEPLPGAGGGGGLGRFSGVPGNGGNGGKYGGAGGGGGNSADTSSGNGGNGAPGIAIVIEHY